LECPPFEIPFEDIYKEAFKDKRPHTVLQTPYFHLFLDGYDPVNYEIVVATRDGEPVGQQINKTEKGYVISFRPSRNAFDSKEGIRGLKLLAMPRNAETAKQEAKFDYRLEASDYRFKEFMAMRK